MSRRLLVGMLPLLLAGAVFAKGVEPVTLPDTQQPPMWSVGVNPVIIKDGFLVFLGTEETPQGGEPALGVYAYRYGKDDKAWSWSLSPMPGLPVAEPYTIRGIALQSGLEDQGDHAMYLAVALSKCLRFWRTDWPYESWYSKPLGEVRPCFPYPDGKELHPTQMGFSGPIGFSGAGLTVGFLGQIGGSERYGNHGHAAYFLRDTKWSRPYDRYDADSILLSDLLPVTDPEGGVYSGFSRQAVQTPWDMWVIGEKLSPADPPWWGRWRRETFRIPMGARIAQGLLAAYVQTEYREDKPNPKGELAFFDAQQGAPGRADLSGEDLPPLSLSGVYQAVSFENDFPEKQAAYFAYSSANSDAVGVYQLRRRFPSDDWLLDGPNRLTFANPVVSALGVLDKGNDPHTNQPVQVPVLAVMECERTAQIYGMVPACQPACSEDDCVKLYELGKECFDEYKQGCWRQVGSFGTRRFKAAE